MWMTAKANLTQFSANVETVLKKTTKICTDCAVMMTFQANWFSFETVLKSSDAPP